MYDRSRSQVDARSGQVRAVWKWRTVGPALPRSSSEFENCQVLMPGKSSIAKSYGARALSYLPSSMRLLLGAAVLSVIERSDLVGLISASRCLFRCHLRADVRCAEGSLDVGPKFALARLDTEAAGLVPLAFDRPRGEDADSNGVGWVPVNSSVRWIP